MNSEGETLSPIDPVQQRPFVAAKRTDRLTPTEVSQAIARKKDIVTMDVRKAFNSPSDDSNGTDLTQGIASSAIPGEGVFGGHVGNTPVLLARVEGTIVAIDGACSHY